MIDSFHPAGDASAGSREHATPGGGRAQTRTRLPRAPRSASDTIAGRMEREMETSEGDAMPGPSGACTLLELIEAGARQRGSSPALLAPDRPPLGYDALLQQIERVGASLAAMGVGRGQRVALALPNGPEMAVALLSAMSWASCAP